MSEQLETKKIFTESDYKKIESICNRFLFRNLKPRHLEDLIQFCCLKYFENGCAGNIIWFCIDYCRLNGIGKRSKLGSMAIENSLSIDYPGSEDTDSLSMYLIDNQQVHDEVNECLNTVENIYGYIEELLVDLSLTKDCKSWALEHYQIKKKWLQPQALRQV